MSFKTNECQQLTLDDSDTLLKICGDDYLDVTEYQLFIRCLSDQTVVEYIIKVKTG